MDTTPYWRRVWYTVTGQNKLVTAAEIKTVLEAIQEDLLFGVNKWTPYTQASYQKWEETLNVKWVNMRARNLAQNLSSLMNLDTRLAWKVFCNFLMFEYHAVLEDVLDYTDYEMRNQKLFEQVWLFYCSERIFMLKTTKYLIQNCINKNHQYNDLYIQFLNNLDFNHVRGCFFTQFDSLIHEINSENSRHCHSLRDWVNRNVQEQVEILSCMILSAEHLPFNLSEYKEILEIFKKHNFTNDPPFYLTLEYASPGDLKLVRKLEVLVLLVGLNHCWGNPHAWRSEAGQLEKVLMSLRYDDYLSILLITWTTLLSTLPSKIASEKYTARYHKVTKAALEEKVFVLMHDIITDPVLVDSSILSIIQRTFYNIVDHVCRKFDYNGSVIQYNGVVGLCIELIKYPQSAIKFIGDSEDGASVIYQVLYEMFPCSFDKFSEAVLQLVQHEGTHLEVTQTMGHFRHYTEETGDIFPDGVVRVIEDYHPYQCVKVEANTEAIIFPKFDKVFIRYPTSYTYFELGEEKLYESVIKRSIAEDVDDVELYLRLMETLLRLGRIDAGDVKPILDNVGNVLINISKKPVINFKLMGVCLDIYETVMNTHGEQIVEMLVVNNFLPVVMKNPTDLNNYFDKNFYSPNIILTAITEELNRGECDLLFTYFNLIRLAPKTEQNVRRIQIPSLVFLFTHVLPTHLDGIYTDISDKYETTQLCLRILLDVLTSTFEMNKYEEILYDFCYNVTINYEPTVKTLLKIFRVSNLYLHLRMLREFSWESALTLTIIHNVKLCMNVFIQAFSLTRSEDTLRTTVLFDKFFDSDVKPSSMKVLIGYLDHAFDPGIPKSACRLLKTISAHTSIQILALLEMHTYQIQNIFLEKLRDPLEEEDMKVSILELITLCIQKQNGLTVAFFDLRQSPTKKVTYTERDSIITFMEEYLDNIQKSTTYLNSPIQGAVLDLFHTLWMYRKDILVKQLTQNDNFWLMLTDPLFRELKLSNKNYSQIFNILTLELYRSKGEDDKINAILHKFFQKDLKYAEVWCDHIVSCLDETSSEVYGLNLIHAWRSFIMVAAITYQKCLESPDLRRLLVETCLKGLLEHFTRPDDIRILINCAELYVFLTKRWPNYYDDHRQILSSLTKVFKYLGKYYDHVNKVFKNVSLIIAIQTIKDFRDYAASTRGLFEEFLYTIGVIFEKEYLKITSEETKPTTKKSYLEWLLLLILANNLITLNYVEVLPTWFSLMQFGHKIMTSVGFLMTDPDLFTIAKIAIQCLTNYAKTSMVREFLGMDFHSFFDSIRPPKQYIYIDATSFKTSDPVYFEEWWLVYTSIMQLMTVLFEQIHKFKMDIFFSFVSIHEDVIRSVLRLPRVTAERSALQLTTVCLYFCYKLLPWRQEWKVNQAQIYFSTMRTIYETLNAITCIFLRPKVLTFFSTEEEGTMKLLDTIPINHLVNIMDQLMQIVAMCCSCLIQAGPSLHSLLSPPIKTSYINDIEIEFDFHIPQLYQEHPQTITYSTILCLQDFLCKAITSIHAQKLTSQKSDENTEGDDKNKNYLVFVCPDYAGSYSISERYSSASSEVSGLSAPWLTKLDLKNVMCALETLGSVIAAQAYISFNIRELRPDLHQHFKKELCAGLMYFYEFVRKRYVDSNQYRVLENMVYRRNMVKPLPYAVNWARGEIDVYYARRCATDWCLLNEDEGAETNAGGDLSNESPESYDQLDSTVFFTRKDFKSIERGADKAAGDTSFNTGRYLNPYDQVYCYGQKDLNGRTFKIPLSKVLMKYPKPPQIREADYLLFLIHWFIFFCDLTH